MPAGKITTHILDTASGLPAAGVRVELHRIEGGARVPVSRTATNSDGRTDAPLAEGGSFLSGTHEIDFHIGDYFDSAISPRFLDVVTVRFTVAEGQRYHVPLLASPFGYTTYRGS